MRGMIVMGMMASQGVRENAPAPFDRGEQMVWQRYDDEIEFRVNPIMAPARFEANSTALGFFHTQNDLI
jgi:hypothetical protein